MSDPIPVQYFRTVFRQALKKGETASHRNDAQLDVNVAIKRLEKPLDVLRCLDIYCTLVDPQIPFTDRNAFEIGRQTGYSLLVRAVELSSKNPDLAYMVAAFPAIATVPVADERKDKSVAYSHRWAMLEAVDRQRLVALAQNAIGLIHSGKQHWLLEKLREAMPAGASGASPSLTEMLAFEPAARAGAKAEFIAAVAVCHRVCEPRSELKQDAIKALDTAFEDFGELLKREMRRPIDFFRMLKWLREPYETAYSRTIQGVPMIKMKALDEIAQILYLEIAWRGQTLASTRWNHLLTQSAKGFAGDDLAFVLQPLDEHGRALLQARLKAAWTNGATFVEMIEAWRQARLLGRYDSINILDEVEVVDLSTRAKEGWTKNPVLVANRFIHHADQILRRDQIFWVNKEFEYGFNIMWIDPGPTPGSGTAFITIRNIPGFVFSANDSALAHLQEEEFFRDLARNAQALTVFLLTYLRVLGFAFEIAVTAISGGFGEVVFEFAKNRLVEHVTDTGMDVLGIKNPYLRAGIGIATGVASSFVSISKLTSAPIRTLEQIEAREIEDIVTVALEWEKRLAKARGLLERGTVAPIAEIGNRNFISLDFENAKPALASAADGAAAPKGVGIIDSGKAAIADHGIGGTPMEPLHSPELASASADAPDIGSSVRAQANISERTAGAATNARATSGVATNARGTGGGVGGGGTGRKLRPRLADKFRESDRFKLLERYDEYQPERSKLEVPGARNALARKVEVGSMTIEAADAELLVLLNKAREQTGELVAAMVVLSNFKGARLIASIPTRGDGPPIIDLVFSIQEKGRKTFILVEAKGGKATPLGWTNNYEYAANKATGGIRRIKASHLGEIRQASGEWYYQRFAEIYMAGGKANEEMAIELMTAAREGRIISVVSKSNHDFDPNFSVTSDKIIKYFGEKDWVKLHNGFWLPANGRP